ncbi:MAG: carboxymuconolactone decarboxylase family protein [Solirubrobacterales bacterium]
MSATAPPLPHPRTFASAGEALSDVAAVVGRAGPLVAVYLGARLDPMLRERVMVAVSQVNACAGCARVHRRLALRAGLAPDELEAIGLGDRAALDERSRAAVIYASELAERRFRAPPSPEVEAAAREHLKSSELAAVEAVARGMALANLTANSAKTIARGGGG